jgi:transposase
VAHAALSNDLRQRLLEAVDHREASRRKLASRFKVNLATVTRLLRLRRETGSYEPRPHGGGVTPTLDGDALVRLRRLVEEAPDAALDAKDLGRLVVRQGLDPHQAEDLALLFR